MFEIGNNIVTTTSTETTMEIGMIELYVPPQNRESSSSEGGGTMSGIEDKMQKRLKRLDTTNNNLKDM